MHSPQRALNEKHRKLASQRWDMKPLADLMTCRLVMEPLRELMKQPLDMSGTRWEDQQLHQAVADDICRHKLPALVALQAVRLLLTEALWSELPTPCLHVAHRCLIFRMVSRIGCCVEQMLRAQHRWLPIALFRLLRTPAEATAKVLTATPECSRDSRSAHFWKEHPDLCADEALAALTAVAVLCKVGIAQIECHHAAVQQTHVMNFEELSGHFTAQRHRK